MFKAFSSIGKAAELGRLHYQYVVKSSLPLLPEIGNYLDTNQASGVPVYNAFVGTALSFTPLIGQKNQGINVGNFISGSSKHLLRMQLLNLGTSVPNRVYLNDYLGFYPLIDCDNTDPQTMENLSPLPRYADGAGVQAVLIVTAPMVVTAPITITYTNSDGVSGRTSTFSLVAGANIGLCATANGANGISTTSNPFIPLDNGDTGIRSIDKVVLSSGAGGFVCIALVKPITTMMIYETGVACEKNFGIDNQNLPEVIDGAYLNFLIANGTTTANRTTSLQAELIFINS